jgi:hypothetical protein
MSTPMTYYFSWGYIRVNTYWQGLSRRRISSHSWNWLIFCNYILLNLKFSVECFVDLFFSTFYLVLCVVCHSVNYVMWLPFCPLCCLSFCKLRHMITLSSFVLSVILWIMSFDYPVCCLSFCELRHMITLCVACHSMNYVIWLPFVLSVILWITSYDYHFVLCVVSHSVNYVIWLPCCPLCCLSFCELRHMITILISSYFSYNMLDYIFSFKHIVIKYSKKHSLFLICHSNKQVIYKKSSKIPKG